MNDYLTCRVDGFFVSLFRLAPEPRDALEVRRLASDPSVEFRRGRDEPREAFDVARDTAPEPMPKDALDTRRDSCDIGVAASWHTNHNGKQKMRRKYVKKHLKKL